jgi:hypothetical protein
MEYALIGGLTTFFGLLTIFVGRNGGSDSSSNPLSNPATHGMVMRAATAIPYIGKALAHRGAESPKSGYHSQNSSTPQSKRTSFVPQTVLPKTKTQKPNTKID